MKLHRCRLAHYFSSMKSCTLAEPQNCHLEESPVLVTVEKSLDKAVAGSPRVITLDKQKTSCLKLIKPSVPPLPPIMQNLPCLTGEPQPSCLPFPPPDFHRSHLHVFFIPTYESYDQHPHLIYFLKKRPLDNLV